MALVKRRGLSLFMAMISVGMVMLAGRGHAAAPCGAKEVCPGFVIAAANIDSVMDSTIEGVRVGDALTNRLQYLIRNHGLTIAVQKSTPVRVDPRLIEATKKYSPAVTIDPNTRLISNYKAGVPFPNIDSKDPLAGTKVIWNYNFSQVQDHFGSTSVQPSIWPLIDARTGIERVQYWNFIRYVYIGRKGSEPPVVGDGSVHHKSLLFAVSPQDIKGIGTFSIRYTTGQLDDTWAYVRAVRRVRRLSGGSWMDPIGGTDHLQDDLETFNAFPTWYPSYRLLGRQKMLMVAEGRSDVFNANASGQKEMYPILNLEAAPYWNPKDNWEVRDVYVVESTTPDFHPYTKKVNWMDAENWRPYLAETFDKKGDFWKSIIFGSRPFPLSDGYNDPATGKPFLVSFTSWGVNADYQRGHATSFFVPDSFQVNPPWINRETVSLSNLEAAGR